MVGLPSLPRPLHLYTLNPQQRTSRTPSLYPSTPKFQHNPNSTERAFENLNLQAPALSSTLIITLKKELAEPYGKAQHATPSPNKILHRANHRKHHSRSTQGLRVVEAL